MNGIWVSVIIPAMNARDTVGRAIMSVERQQGIDPNVTEIVVVDDGSDDGTAQFVRENYPFVKIFFSGGKGVSAARNAGIANSNGRYIAFLDADDEWKPEKLYWQIKFMEDNADYVLCGCTADYYDATGHFLMKGRKEFDGNAIKRLIGGNFIITSSVVVRRNTFEKECICFNDSIKFGEDWQLWLRISARGKIKIFGNSLVRYTCYPTRKYSIDAVESSLQQIVDSLFSDNVFMEAFGSNGNSLMVIRDLALIGCIRERYGCIAATYQGIRILIRRPTLLLPLIRKIL